MTPERWKKLDALFHEALALQGAARAAHLAEVCGDDEQLRAEAGRLLAAHERESSFLDAPVLAGLAVAARQESPIGRSIGPYQILALLGKGGMGEVFLAEDARLERQVALKLLPAAFTQNQDRVRRFEREAKAASALNHPNILTIHEIGQAAAAEGGIHYIVSEFVAGETLRALLERGRLAINEATTIAAQVASALGVAHEAGIMHRDIKPENVMVRPDGLVKVLDFGLAKLTERQGDRATGRRGESDGSPQLPVSPSPSLTEPGVVLGTAAYMSPEQVRGEAVDHRSDLFSLGLLLFELLQGERAFQRATRAETMAAILNDEPPELSATKARVAPQLEKIVRRCLEKQPERRFHSAHDLGFALETLSSSGAQHNEAAPARETATLSKRSLWRERSWMMAAGVMTLLALALGVAYVRRPALDAEPLRFSLNPPEQAKLFDWPTISPDGRMLAFIAEVDGKTQLWVRALGATTARPLVEVSDSRPNPFWSPDNQFIAYFEQRKLKKIALTGGTPEILCDTPILDGGTWNREGVILFGSGPAGLSRVSANGGAVTAATSVDTARGDTAHIAPTFLPDGRHFLFYSANPDRAKSGIYLASLEGGEARRLLSVDVRNVGVAVNPAERSKGYLAFVRQGALLAQAYDFSRNQLMGNPVRIAEHVSVPIGVWARFSLATNGVLLLLESDALQQLTWFDRAGKKLGTVGPTGRYSFPKLSPDGRRVAVGRTNSAAQLPAQLDDIYLFELASGAGTPFTFDPAQDEDPTWSPDGSRLAWDSSREGETHLFQQAASGAGQGEVLLRSAYRKYVSDWSTDGRFILYEEVNPQTSADLWVLPLKGERRPWLWLSTPFNERQARFSPAGRWIAYRSNESGRNEIYVQAFVLGASAAGGKRQLSTAGGTNPQWRRDGRELYYLAAEGKLMSVAITPGANLQAGTPQALFTPSGFRLNTDRGYTLTGDGQRFLFVTRADDAHVPPFTVVLNWMAEVKK